MTCALAAVLFLTSCSSSADSPPAPSSAALLRNIPPADPAKYPSLRERKSWRNPYLVIRTDRVGLVTSTEANEERILKPPEVLDALAQLPLSSWPYGRAVAVLVDEKSAASEQDRVALRKDRGIVVGQLEGAHVAINWIPTS